MAESEVVETTPESQDSEKYAGGNGSPSGGTSTEGGPTEENNADSTESSPHEQTESSPHERIYMNFEVDPNRKGGSVGEGAQKDVSHPKGADTQSLGQINKGEHDNQGNGDPSVVDGNFHDNCPGSTVTEKNAPPDTKGGDTKFQESDIQDSHDDSEEPMDEGAPDTGDEPQVRSNKPDSIEQSEDDSEMDVDDATGQPSTAAKSGTEHATERENEGDGQGGNSVGEPKQTVERKDDGIGLGVSSDVGSEQKHTVEKSPAEATGETKCTTEGKNDGSGQAGTEAGNTQTRTTEEIDESLAGTAGESNHAVEGENNEVGSPAGTGSKQKHKTKGMDGGNRRGRSHAGARTKREVPPQKKDDDDHDSRYGRSWASRDTQRYRSGYQGISRQDDPRLDKNYKFYTNQIPSEPNGDLIEEIHANWKGNYTHLEMHHGYIQWLFPIRERGLNWHAQELQSHEIMRICDDPEAFKRILTSYELMLDFYGMKLKDPETGELERADNWEGRFRDLNRSWHNYLRITRILKCLGEFGYEKLKAPFVRFVLREAIVERTLDNTMDSCLNYWLEVIRDDKEREEIKKYARELQDDEKERRKKKKKIQLAL